MPICAVDQTTAAAHCIAAGGSWAAATVCPEAPAETSGNDGNPAQPWNPDRGVTFDATAGEYLIDRDLFESLKADPAPLAQDSTGLRELDDGHYQVTYTGELSDALGWEPGDVILSVDGHDLRGLDGFVSAYAALADNSVFVLEIQRDRSTVGLRYRVE